MEDHPQLVLRPLLTRRDRNGFIDFIYQVYRGNHCYKDTLMSVIVSFLNKQDTFSRLCDTWPVQVVRDGIPVAQSIFIFAPGFPYLQIAFFECLPGCYEAADLLVSEARKLMLQLNCEGLTAGLNGHVACGIGFLSDAYDLPASFDSQYSLSWYIKYFRERGWKEKTLTAWKIDLKDIRFKPRQSRGISIRSMDMRQFRSEIERMGDLANRFLAETDYYFPRSPKAMADIIMPLRPFLRPENLLFASAAGKDIGFLFWHPDYNTIFPGGRKVSMIELGFRYLFSGSGIRAGKLNAIGVDKDHWNGIAAMYLLSEAQRAAGSGFDTVETNFIWDSNTRSKGLVKYFPFREHRHYSAFEMPAERGAE